MGQISGGGSSTGLGTAGPGVPGGGGSDTQSHCIECEGNYSFFQGGFCQTDNESFINKGERAYKIDSGKCVYIKCIPNIEFPDGQQCIEITESSVTENVCTSYIGDWRAGDAPNSDLNGSVVTQSSFESSEFPGNTPEELGEFNCFKNENRYEAPDKLPVSSSKHWSGGDSCGWGVISNGFGLISNCKRSHQMGTLINHWDYSVPGSPTPEKIKSCLLPKKWTFEDTKKFIEDHWINGLSWNANRGPKTVPGYGEVQGFVDFRISYPSSKNTSSDGAPIVFKKIKTIHNGEQIEICTPIFSLDADLSNLEDCD
jgi:hypothetical protein